MRKFRDKKIGAVAAVAALVVTTFTFAGSAGAVGEKGTCGTTINFTANSTCTVLANETVTFTIQGGNGGTGGRGGYGGAGGDGAQSNGTAYSVDLVDLPV